MKKYALRHIFRQNKQRKVMMPRILEPSEGHDFHDSELIKLAISSDLLTVTVVVSTPHTSTLTKNWQIKCEGVLRLEYETLGEGEPNKFGAPIQIYDIYNDKKNPERKRWVERLKRLEIATEQAEQIFHVVLASSFIRGWGKNEDIEGINIICRKVSVSEFNG